MATPQRFRSAFNGFNRDDVVNYIEYLNNRYTAQLDQLNNQLKESKEGPSSDVVAGLQAQLDAALMRCAELEEQLNNQQEATVSRELEAYRRAENAERLANARAQKIYDKVYSAIDEATGLAESATGEFSIIAQRTIAQLQEYQASVALTVQNFKNAAAAMQSAKPELAEEE